MPLLWLGSCKCSTNDILEHGSVMAWEQEHKASEWI